MSLNDAQIKHMVGRFLCWRLPVHFNPDGGISFNEAYRSPHGPSGTNLFDAQQATAMVRHMVDGMPDEAVETYKAKNAKNGWTGRGFSFDPGFLNLDREGAATIGFAESDMQYERADDTGKDYVYCNVPVSEILALRDYLNEAFPSELEPA